jgi:hypothetical protein
MGGEGPEQGDHPAVLGAVHERGGQLENAVEQHEDPDDHRQCGQAVAGLEEDRDPHRDAEHAD